MLRSAPMAKDECEAGIWLLGIWCESSGMSYSPGLS